MDPVKAEDTVIVIDEASIARSAEFKQRGNTLFAGGYIPSYSFLGYHLYHYIL